MKKAVSFGEVLWDLLPSGKRAGGAPMNVAYHLQKLGWKASLISRIGEDALGTELKGVLTKSGINSSLLQSDPLHATGIVNATIGANYEVSYEIVQPVAWDFIEVSEPALEAVSDSDVFIFGSLALRQDVSRKTLLALLEGASFPVMDINLRPPHFSRDIITPLLSRVKILKLNEHELPLISSWFHSGGSAEQQVRFLQHRFQIPTIVLTKGGAGAAVLHQHRWNEHPGFQVTVADTVGSGDAFLAGFISKLMMGDTADRALEFSNRLGAFIASRNGACPEYDPKEI